MLKGGFMKKYLFLNKRSILGYSLMAVVTYFTLTLLYQGYSLITEVVERPDSNSPIVVTFICIGVLLTLLLFLNIMSVLKRKVIYNINLQLRNDFFHKIFQNGYLDFRRNHGKEFYNSVLLNDLEIIQEDFFSNAIEFIGDTFQLIIMLTSIAFVGRKYLGIVVLFSIPSIVHPFLLKRMLEKNSRRVSEQKEAYTKRVEHLLESYFVFKTYGQEKILNQLYNRSVNDLEKGKKIENNWKVVNSCIMAFFVYVLKVGSQLYFTYGAIQGIITVATVTLLLGLANNVGNPIAGLLSYLSVMNSTKAVRKKCERILEKTVDLSGQADEWKDLPRGTDIRLENVTYQYTEDKKVLNQFSASFESGKKYVILGPSGCGKSTLFQLLLGYLELQEGAIYLGDRELRSIDSKVFHSIVSSVSQTPYFFSGTIRENLTMMKDGFSDEKVWKALEMAGIRETIQTKKYNLDERVEAGGRNFSGGEKQRMAIARALLFETDIILIDEGMAALDNDTAVRIEEMLLALEGKTVISISHRIQESIKLYDEIILMEQGRIAERGTYEYLKENSRLFEKYMCGGEYRNEIA